MPGTLGTSYKWVWGHDPDKGTSNAANNLLNSTGAGVAVNTNRVGLQYTYHIETNDSGWAYQLRGARTSSGPWAVLSSNSGTSTAVTDIVQMPGPFRFLSPRVDTLASTANYVMIVVDALEA